MAVITILDRSNIPRGPFTREQVAEKLRIGEFTLESLGYVEGLTTWTPLRDVLARIDLPGLPEPVAFIPPPVPSPIAPPAAYSYAVTMAPPPHLVYAGFWVRVAATCIDSLLMLIPIFVLGLIIGAVAGGYTATFRSESGFPSSAINPVVPMVIVLSVLGTVIVFAIIGWLYHALLESGASQGTFGKQVLGLRVTDMTGNRINFGLASARYFCKIATGMAPFGMGYVMMVFMEQKQTLHDLVVGTLVIRE